MCYDAFLAHRRPEFALPSRLSDKCSHCAEYYLLNSTLNRKCRHIQLEHQRKLDEQKMKFENDETSEDGDVLDDMLVDKSLPELNACKLGKMNECFDDDSIVISEDGRQLWKNRLENYELLIAHRSENKETRAKYNADIDDMKQGEMVLAFDHKQNLIVGHCPDEEHWRFRNLSQRTCFNVTLYTVDKLWRIDVISDCLNTAHYSPNNRYVLYWTFHEYEI